MPDIISEEGLMIWAINKLSEKFGEKALLKGGMVLRLMNCSRKTHDIDYVFSPFKSKKDIWPLIKDALSELEGAEITHELHSTSLRIQLRYNNLKIKIEATASQDEAFQNISTALLSKKHNLVPHVIQIMDMEISLSNKLAAWNERGLMRDLYDIHFIAGELKIKPDLAILSKRLSRINTRKRSAPKVKSITLGEFWARLEQKVSQLTDEEVFAELSNALPDYEIPGISLIIRRSIMELINKMKDTPYKPPTKPRKRGAKKLTPQKKR